MPLPATPHVADQLEHYAGEPHSAAFDFREPARDIAAAEKRIALVEQIVADVRRVVRG